MNPQLTTWDNKPLRHVTAGDHHLSWRNMVVKTASQRAARAPRETPRARDATCVHM